MRRRSFLAGLTALASGLLVPVPRVAVPERRFWRLDGTMASPDADFDDDDWDDDESYAAQPVARSAPWTLADAQRLTNHALLTGVIQTLITERDILKWEAAGSGLLVR